ncbi:MAG: protein-export chaperone SecB [Gammaproteobacteria bacterium]
MADIPEKVRKDVGTTETSAKSGQFALQKIYVKDISFETPHTPGIFTENWTPAVNMQLASEASQLNDELAEIVLKVTVTTTLGEKTAYLVETHVAGVFLFKGFPQNVVEHMAATVCPNILFPFAREVVSDLVTRGGFPQLLLAPVNFEALYAQQKRQKVETAAGDGSGTKH